MYYFKETFKANVNVYGLDLHHKTIELFKQLSATKSFQIDVLIDKCIDIDRDMFYRFQLSKLIVDR